MNQLRIIQCGTMVFAIGQLFDPNDLVDVRTVTDPVELIQHQFDGIGMVRPINEEATGASGTA
jgi:hypothetical protein